MSGPSASKPTNMSNSKQCLSNSKKQKKNNKAVEIVRAFRARIKKPLLSTQIPP